jgi:membrane-associated phospholipid phosphatase
VVEALVEVMMKNSSRHGRRYAKRPILGHPTLTPALALAFFLLVASIDEPTTLDRAIYDLAGRLYDRRLERAQRPFEIIGLPGAYIPLAYLIARSLRKRGKRGGEAVVAAAWSGWLAVRVMRLLIHRPRPPRPPGRGPKRESTFPSGHTVGLTTLALVVAEELMREGLLNRRQASAIGLGVPLIIGADRLYVREHWLTDVVGAWALGGAVAAANRYVRRAARRST